MQQVEQFHWKRKITQAITIGLIILVPVSGIFRIDLATASFIVFGQQVMWSNYMLVFGLALMVATIPIITYMTIGTVWCGWACPQNMLSEWANKLTFKFLGKRASVDIDQNLKIAANKNKLINWVILAVVFLLAAMVLAIVPFFLFFSPAEVWGMITFDSSSKLAVFMHRLYYFAVFLLFLNIAVIRHFFCDYICVYRIGQRMFKTDDALHINYDASRSADCVKCNFCKTSCITGIDPTNTGKYDSCINCGECIDACNRLHAKTNTHGLLNFAIGEKKGRTSFGEKVREVIARFNWVVGGIFLVGVAMFAWGVNTQMGETELLQQKQVEQQQILKLTAACKGQCEAQHAGCSAGQLSACFQASACECQCKLHADPENPSSAQWQQCVKTNNEKAKQAVGRRLPLSSAR